MDKATFRAAFPEFTSTARFPDAMLDFWATLAERQLPDAVWTTLKTTAVQLYVAHEITLASQNVSVSTAGGVPGQSGGIAQSKAVGSVNVSYDTQSISETGAGWWNLTNYGKQLYRLIKLFGAGCIQL